MIFMYFPAIVHGFHWFLQYFLWFACILVDLFHGFPEFLLICSMVFMLFVDFMDFV